MNYRSNPNSRGKTKARILLIVGVTVTLLAVVWTTVFITSSILSNDSEGPVNPESRVIQDAEITKGASGKTIVEDQRDALAAATALLNNAGKSPSGEKPEERLKKLQEQDFSAISKETMDSIRFPESFPVPVKVVALQGLVTTHTIITQGDATKTISPLDAEAYKEVYVDSKLGVAFVPTNLYFDGSAFTFEFVHVDGKWQFYPMTFADSIKISAMLQMDRE